MVTDASPPTCVVELPDGTRCQKPRRYVASGLCGMHYQRLKFHGDLHHERAKKGENVNLCQIGDPPCGRPCVSHGRCAAHQQRWLTHGDVFAHIPIETRLRWPESLLRRLRFCPPDAMPTGCIEYTGDPMVPYGEVSTGNGESKQAHVAVWLWLRGPYPKGWHLDHLCRNTRCCNPGHLEPVPSGVNVMRGDSPPARNARKTECKRGHEYTPENTYVDKRGTRHCRQCKRDNARKRYKPKRSPTKMRNLR